MSSVGSSSSSSSASSSTSSTSTSDTTSDNSSVGSSDLSSSSSDNLSSSSSSSNNSSSTPSSALSGPTTGDQLASSPTTAETLSNEPTTAEKLSGSYNHNAATNTASANGSTEPAQNNTADIVNQALGYTIDAGKTMTEVQATSIKQQAISAPVEYAAERLNASGDTQQVAQAKELVENSKNNAGDYDLDKAHQARNTILGDNSVTGTKLSKELSEAAPKVNMADNMLQKAGIVGDLAGPALGAASEIGKLPENASDAEKLTAGIIGSLKTIDNAVVSTLAGKATTLLTAVTGPGAIAAGAAGGVAADTIYSNVEADHVMMASAALSLSPTAMTSAIINNAHSTDNLTFDQKFDSIVDNTQPAILNGVETAFSIREAMIDTTVNVGSYVYSKAEQGVNTLLDTGDELDQQIDNFIGEKYNLPL